MTWCFPAIPSLVWPFSWFSGWVSELIALKAKLLPLFTDTSPGTNANICPVVNSTPFKNQQGKITNTHIWVRMSCFRDVPQNDFGAPFGFPLAPPRVGVPTPKKGQDKTSHAQIPQKTLIPSSMQGTLELLFSKWQFRKGFEDNILATPQREDHADGHRRGEIREECHQGDQKNHQSVLVVTRRNRQELPAWRTSCRTNNFL